MATFTEETLKQFRKTMQPKQLLILKFTADWCGPCQKIAPICKNYINNLPETIIFYEIDVDESLDLYMKLKKYKMLNGIPAILAFTPGKDIDEHWYVPAECHLGGDINGVKKFFESCMKLVE